MKSLKPVFNFYRNAHQEMLIDLADPIDLTIQEYITPIKFMIYGIMNRY